MNSITIVGGIYHEHCVWPDWNHVYGSAGRAAVALCGQVQDIVLCGYVHPDLDDRVQALAKVYNFRLNLTAGRQVISFSYVHSLSTPTIRPLPALIKPSNSIDVVADVVLRFGMLEGSAAVKAKCCVYDPQSAFDPEPFSRNGSNADRLAIVGNSSEIIALGGEGDPIDAATKLLDDGADVVVVKSGAKGASVVEKARTTQIPAYRSDFVWKIGSGDVFAAMFAAQWGVHALSPVEAATIASKAVATYVNSQELPLPSVASLSARAFVEAKSVKGRVYIASPFFSLGQRWLVDETRQSLRSFGMDVFSPVHDVGPGPAHVVAPADLAELHKCDVILGILDGNDPGTIFELGYARALHKPVYALAQTVSEEDLKMVEGSGCKIFSDFVSCLHHVVWRS